MSEIISPEVSVFDATITVPTNGDLRDAASIKVASQSFANRTRRLKDAAEERATLLAFGSGNVSQEPGSFTVRQSIAGAGVWNNVTLPGVIGSSVNQVGADFWFVSGQLTLQNNASPSGTEFNVRIIETVTGLVSAGAYATRALVNGGSASYVVPETQFFIASAITPVFAFQVQSGDASGIDIAGPAVVSYRRHQTVTV